MKNSTWIILLSIIFNSIALQAKNNHRDLPVICNSFASFGIGQVNNLNSFTPFYTQNFSGGVPAGWQRLDSSGSGIKWHFTTTGAFNPIYDSLSVSGTSAGNGYMIYDSDSANGNAGPDNADLISASINCSTHNNVHLTFNQYLIHYNDTATVWVSSNGTNWTQVHNSSTGLLPQESTSNPNAVDIDISSIAANQATVYLRFNYKADYSFFWMIDDVSLYESPSIEASLTGIIAPATSCSSLSATEAVTVNVYNSGGDSITGGYNLTFIANGGSPVTEHLTDTLVPGGNKIYTFTATANLSAPGNHSITAYIVVVGDTVTSNDTITKTVRSGPIVINTVNSYSTGFEPNQDLTGYLTVDGNNDSNTWNISNQLPHNGNYCMAVSSDTASEWLFTPCFHLDSSLVYTLSYFYRTSSTATQANFHVMIGAGQSPGNMSQEIVPTTLVTSLAYLPGSAQFTVTPSGTYYIGFQVTNADSLTGFRLDDINITASSSVGIKSINQMPVTIFPNPSTGIVYLNTSVSSSSGFSIEVFSSIGTLVSSRTTDALNHFEMDLRNQPAGIYMIRVVSDNGISTRKISVNH